MKKYVIFPILAVLLLVSCGKKEKTSLQKGSPAYKLASAVSVKVPYLAPGKNNVLISTKDFKITSDDVFQTLYASSGNGAEQLKAMGADRLKQVMEQTAANLAEKKLLLESAKKAGVSVSEAELDSSLNQQYKHAGGKEKFMGFLNKRGIDPDYVKNDIHKVLIIQKYLDKELSGQTKVTEADIQKAYKEDKTATVRHILLLTQGKSDSAKKAIRKKMEGILARAKSGENFAKLAKEYSEDKGSKENGGLYKDFGRGRMVKPFEEAAFNTPIGQISGIIQTRYGYHILKVINRKKETRPLKEVRGELERQIKQQKQKEAYNAFIKKLKKDAGFKAIDF
ncbi:foldase protein PrsA 3 precursor [bacterium BMS3Abin05]|nr:foldase protein PrsA 3 precursor [bacterium BMS3Abin05]GBE28986.1 foldase protein PrsA 3 precursor [bacterium BMS3Bbin03]HDZ11766.1 hypothetical protein [Bacteroidota bacterium]